MADRAYWKGYLKLSLVTCPVALTPATSDSEKIRFHNLNRKTGHRVATRFVDSLSGEPVEEEAEAKGYERAEDDYLILEEEDLESVALESTRTIDIERFVPNDSIPWIYRDKPHYLYPNDEVGTEAFAVIRDAMKDTQVAGVARLVLYRRERAVLLLPEEKGIVLWTLRYGDEVRDESTYYSTTTKPKADPELVKLAKTVISERTRHWDKDLVEDPVQNELLKIIASKKRKPIRPPPEGGKTKSNVIDLFDALKKSLRAKEASPALKKSRPRKS